MIDDLEVYDTVSLDTVEVGDNIIHGEDILTITKVVDSGEAIAIHGESHITGDSVFYTLYADTKVDLWTV